MVRAHGRVGAAAEEELDGGLLARAHRVGERRVPPPIGGADVGPRGDKRVDDIRRPHAAAARSGSPRPTPTPRNPTSPPWATPRPPWTSPPRALRLEGRHSIVAPPQCAPSTLGSAPQSSSSRAPAALRAAIASTIARPRRVPPPSPRRAPSIPPQRARAATPRRRRAAAAVSRSPSSLIAASAATSRAPRRRSASATAARTPPHSSTAAISTSAPREYARIVRARTRRASLRRRPRSSRALRRRWIPKSRRRTC